jgi:hypothetical protein
VTLPLSYSRSAAKAAHFSDSPARLKAVPFPNHSLDTENPSQQTLGISAPAGHTRRTPQSLEPMIRIELMTSPLPRECSTN